tara:strand:- start:244 stop:1680 length:1437 start_codon:yes stop_codon:yes gene_type:complete
MIKIAKLTFKIIFLLITYSGISQSQKESIERKIDSLFREYNNKTPGVSIAVVKDGQTIFKRGYGSATLEYNVPITPKTIFHVASVSKQFTAFSIYLLKEQGKISLEDDISKYIPELPNYGKPIKINHLLSHTSGLRDQWALLTLAGWHLEDVITTEQILKLATNQKGLNFKTGTEFGYCNTNYTLLAEAVKRITGQSFADFAKENIFDPLGMNNTQFYDDFQKVVKNRAYSYEIRNNEYIKKELNYSNVGPTSLFTTVEDLSKWVANFETHIVGGTKMMREFNEISLLDNNKPVVYRATKKDTLYHAKGQLHWYHKGLKLISHGGHDAGFRAFLARFPENNLSIITLSNDEHYDILKNGLAFADFFLKDQLREVKSTIKPSNQNSDDNLEQYDTKLKEFEGDYYSEELKTVYSIRVRAEKLIIRHKRLSDIELSQVGKEKFSGTNYFPFEMEFLRTNQKVIGFEISNFGAKKVKFERK